MRFIAHIHCRSSCSYLHIRVSRKPPPADTGVTHICIYLLLDIQNPHFTESLISQEKLKYSYVSIITISFRIFTLCYARKLHFPVNLPSKYEVVLREVQDLKIQGTRAPGEVDYCKAGAWYSS